MELGYQHNLYLLAFDHRGSFQKGLFGVRERLRVGARADGFRGFAIGRTLWWDALVAYRDGAIDRREAASRIAAAYIRSIDTYKGGRS